MRRISEKRYLPRNNQPLTTLSLSQTTLEEVFLELTQGKYTASLAEQEIRDDGKEEVTGDGSNL